MKRSCVVDILLTVGAASLNHRSQPAPFMAIPHSNSPGVIMAVRIIQPRGDTLCFHCVDFRDFTMEDVPPQP